MRADQLVLPAQQRVERDDGVVQPLVGQTAADVLRHAGERGCGDEGQLRAGTVGVGVGGGGCRGFTFTAVVDIVVVIAATRSPIPIPIPHPLPLHHPEHHPHRPAWRPLLLLLHLPLRPQLPRHVLRHVSEVSVRRRQRLLLARDHALQLARHPLHTRDLPLERSQLLSVGRGYRHVAAPHPRAQVVQARVQAGEQGGQGGVQLLVLLLLLLLVLVCRGRGSHCLTKVSVKKKKTVVVRVQLPLHSQIIIIAFLF